MTKALTELQKWERRYIPEPMSGCHLWLKYLNNKGYGQTRIGGRAGCNILAHRLAWKIFRGPIPEGLGVLHICDNPCCVNPEHLFIGTQADNAQDMARKGRWGGPRKLPRGAAHPRATAKLSEEDVKAIRIDSRTHKLIAIQYGVSQASVSRVQSRKSFSHVE